jgi:hypothetical protein
MAPSDHFNTPHHMSSTPSSLAPAALIEWWTNASAYLGAALERDGFKSVYVESLSGTDVFFELLPKTEEPPKPRFIIEERSGVIAIYDTLHPEFEETQGCHSDYPWTVASWHGSFNDGYWTLNQWQIDKAKSTCQLLNCLWTGSTSPHSTNN